MHSVEEIERRSPVWQALSDLFLDTELGLADFTFIASTIQAAGFSTDEAEEILRQEVAPVFWTNLCSVAGEWTPWSEEQVRELVCVRIRKQQRGFAWFHSWKSRRQMSLIMPDWLQVRALLEQQEPDSGVKT